MSDGRVAAQAEPARPTVCERRFADDGAEFDTLTKPETGVIKAVIEVAN